METEPSGSGNRTSGSPQHQAVSRGTDAESTVPQVGPPEKTTLGVIEFGGNRPELKAVSLGFQVSQVGYPESVFQEFQIAVDHSVNFKAHETVLVNEQVAALVTSLDDLPRIKV